MNARILLYLALFLMLGLSWAGACVIYRAAEAGEDLLPLEPREFERLTVVTVGTGNESENRNRLGPSTAVAVGDTIVLVDAGRGVAEALRSAKIPVSQPRVVLLSDLRPLNTVGLDDLVFTGWRGAREAPVTLYGPLGTAALAEGLTLAHAAGREAERAGLDLPEAGARIEAQEVGHGFEIQLGPLRVRAAELPGGPTPALAWRFESTEGPSRSVVVAGSGWAPDALVELASGADMLVNEAVYVPTPEDAADAGVELPPERLLREARLHTSLMEVGPLARRAGVRELVLTRMRPPPMYSFQITPIVSDGFKGEVHVAADGDEFQP